MVLVLLCGCRQLLGFEGVTVADATLDPDTLEIPDAGACTALGNECVAGVVLRACQTLGELPVDTTCTWGCIESNPNNVAQPHCGAIEPAGGTAITADLAPNDDLTDHVIADAVLNTETGSITNVRGPGSGILSGIDFQMRNNVSVMRFRSVTFDGVIQVRGSIALVIVADGPIVLQNVVDARGTCTTNSAGPGGSQGGDSGNDGEGAGRGHRGESAVVGVTGGGGGAGFGVAGSPGGNGGGAAQGGAAGSSYGTAAITVLLGGSGGGGGSKPGEGGVGGGGGGAIQLISNTEIRVEGGINAGGCGGGKGTGIGGAGGGGGSGGTILLEAPVVILKGGLAVNGGGGGGGVDGVGDQGGSPGLLGVIGASGGISMGGGAGGTGGAANGLAGTAGQDESHAGGGGGGVGRIRINTRNGSVQVDAGAFTSPTLDAGTATSGMASVK